MTEACRGIGRVRALASVLACFVVGWLALLARSSVYRPLVHRWLLARSLARWRARTDAFTACFLLARSLALALRPVDHQTRPVDPLTPRPKLNTGAFQCYVCFAVADHADGRVSNDVRFQI